MKFIKNIILLLCLAFFTLLGVQAQNEKIISTLEGSNGLKFEIESFEFRETAGRYSPSNGIYLITFAMLRNDTDKELCVYARDVRFIIENEEFPPERPIMDAVQRTLDPRRDYIGPIGGHCVDANSTEPTFVAFDLPIGFTSFTLRFFDSETNFNLNGAEATHSISTPSPSPLAISVGVTISTETLAPTPSFTLAPSITATTMPTPTPIIGSVRSNNVNARSCASTNCEVARTVSTNDELQLLGIVDGWYLVQFVDGEQAYIRSDLMEVPEGVAIPEAPTLVPTRTRVPTETPFVLGEDEILILVRASLFVNDLSIDDIRVEGNTLIVDAPATNRLFNDEGEYRLSLIGALTGAVVAAYRDEMSISSPPANVQVNFSIGGLAVLRVTFAYRDAVRLIDKELTAEQFFARLEVE